MKEYEIVAKFYNACAGTSRPQTFFEEAELENTEELEAPNPRVIALCIVNALLILALILLGTILTKKIHTLEEERL